MVMAVAALPVAMMALTAASTAVGAYGAYTQAQAQKQSAEYQAGVDEQNAKIQERNAQDIEARGRDEQDRYRRRLAQMMGSQRAQLAGTGVDIGSGSALDLMADTAGEGARDTFTMGQNTARSAYEARVGAMSSTAQANMARSTADGISPGLQAAPTLLSGASQFGSQWMTFKQKGQI
jgi:hypothetical protein